MPVLHLHLRGEYFDAILAGEKVEEFRLATPYWRRRLEGRRYDGICLMRGYPKSGDCARHLHRPWKGVTVKAITHPHFGKISVEVYAIKVN